MKKILIIFIFVMTAMMVQAQNVQQVENTVIKEMDALEKVVTLDKPELKFNKNQVVKLERVMLKKAKDLVDLRSSEIAKVDYPNAYNAIVNKYEDQIMPILSTAQKMAYRKNKKKQIKLIKDTH
ncbi:MAG: hypothetical protein V3V14_06245 [Saprospiraceae bacterium]